VLFAQRFEFDHARALMSCIAVNEMTGEAVVYSKGGFESVAHTCRPETGTHKHAVSCDINLTHIRDMSFLFHLLPG
jgi:magnesium-transporting ATPase (P-type)